MIDDDGDVTDGAEIHDECGVFGIIRPGKAAVTLDTYYALYALQHRGQQACGMVISDDGVFTNHRDTGLVGDVFTRPVLEALGEGEMATGHVRYGTSGGGGRINAQPLVLNHVKGPMALAHNGNLVNAHRLRRQLEAQGSIFHTTIDSEVIGYVITKERLTSGSIDEAVERAMPKLNGAYSLVLMTPTKIVAVRDPRGMRPLCYGSLPDGGYAVASETVGLDAVGATYVRDVEPGEIVTFARTGTGASPITVHSNRRWVDSAPHSLCVFEYIYFARPDSIIDGAPVHDARQRAGAFLAHGDDVEADIVIGVPDSGLEAAQGYAKASGLPLEKGFVKNKYIGRTFISPDKDDRKRGVQIKLNPVPSVVRGKRIVLIDDSIVRGTTAGRIINLLRTAGATAVHFRVSAPPFINPCHYGTDIDSRENLIACHYSQEEIRTSIGADSLGYLTVEQVKRIADDSAVTGFCTACFSGDYPTELPEPGPLDRFRVKISEANNKADATRSHADIKEATL